MHALRNPFGGENGAQRQAAGQRLGDGDHIRQHAIMLVGKMASSAAQAALNLVEHEQGAALFGQARGQFEKLRSDRANPALSLNGFDAHSADAGIKLSFQIVQVIELDETHARHERNERRSIFRLTGSGERAKGAPMKRVLHGKNARLWIGLVAVLDWFICAKARASLSAPSQASVPLLQKKARSSPEISVSSRASSA